MLITADMGFFFSKLIMIRIMYNVAIINDFSFLLNI